MMNIKILGNRINELRTKNRMTLEQLGNIVGLKKASLSDVENGKNFVSVEVLIKLADCFKVSTDYILCRTDNPEMNR